MLSEWLMLRSLVGLPGMNTTYQGVVKQAAKGEWRARKREKGKGYEYHISSLPKETQRAINIRAAKARAKEELELGSGLIKQSSSEEQSQALWKRLEQVPLSMQDKAKHKLKVLLEFLELRNSGLTSKEAEDQIKADHKVSRPTLHRWKKAVKEAPAVIGCHC